MEKREIVRQSLRYIETNLEGPLRASEIAKAMGYSEFYFSRMFKEEMQISVMAYVKKQRLIRASEEIVGGARILDIALKFGWESHGGFTRAFKNEFGFYPALLKAAMMGMECLKGENGMRHVFLEKTESYMTEKQLFEVLKQQIQENGRNWDAEELEEVYRFACQAYDGLCRYSGEKYVTHLLNTAILLAQMDCEMYVVYAGMFCDVQEKALVTMEQLREHLPEDTVSLIERLGETPSYPIHADEMEEVIVVRLAERLHNMRTLAFMPETARHKKARETLDIVMEMAKRIENRKLLDELNDLALSFIS